MRVAPWAAAALLLAACAPKPETAEQTAARLKAESDSARTDIEAANAAWARYVAAGHADSVGLLFAEDAVTQEAGKPAVRGRAAIVEDYRTSLANGTYAWTLTTGTVEASGPIAIETGRNIVTYTPGPNAPATMRMASTDTLKYVTTWRKVGGQWLVSNDVATTDRAPQPARKR
jgi:ketosteroid isomerase-like protein